MWLGGGDIDLKISKKIRKKDINKAYLGVGVDEFLKKYDHDVFIADVV